MCKAYSYFASGFVGTVYSHNFDVESICILYASNRRTSPSLVFCAASDAVHSVNSTELTLISIRSPAGLSPLSSDLKSEGPVYTVGLLVVEVVVTLLYSNRRLFLGDLVLECSKGVGKSVGNGLPLVGFPS